jgi:hypothetical protein
MSSELPRDTDSVASSRDSESDIYKKKPIEVIEKSDVLVLGILPELDGLSPELVN